jgi:hypothetical protein
MKKPTQKTQADVWNEDINTEHSEHSQATVETVANEFPLESESVQPPPVITSYDVEYDMEGLMTDFPTATELERFVYDQTGIILNLKGRANKLKYTVALDTLQGKTIPDEFTTTRNPYVDKTEMVPQDEIPPTPPRDKSLPSEDTVQNQFYTGMIPHPDPLYRANDKRCDVVFKKYRNGAISYEILGPLECKPIGVKIDKFGQERPELLSWTDPRSGEQTVQRADGSLTPMGKRLRAFMQKMRVNNSNYWMTWVDREFATIDGTFLDNPWNDGQ